MSENEQTATNEQGSGQMTGDVKENGQMTTNVEAHNWGLEKLHARMLEILKAFDVICAENDIPYCLAFGSALGAERHGGFIPWDDDVDVYMDFTDYPRFKEAFQKSPHSKGLHLQELYQLNGIGTMIKIRMDGTTLIEDVMKNMDIHHGIFMDIFLLSGGSTNPIVQREEHFWAKYITIKRLADIGYNRKKAYVPVLKFLRMFPEKFLCGFAEKKIHKRDSKTTGLYQEQGLGASKCVFPADWLFPPKRVSFSGVMLNVPRENPKYLEMIYGNYMEIPKIDFIQWKQHAAVWDADENYDKYVHTANLLLDEK